MPKQRPDKLPHVVIPDIDLPRCIEAGWEDFFEFVKSDYLEQRINIKDTEAPFEPMLKREFRDKLRQVLEDHPDQTKAIFGSGFMCCLEFFKEVTKEAITHAMMEQMVYHKDDPRVPRA